MSPSGTPDQPSQSDPTQPAEAPAFPPPGGASPTYAPPAPVRESERPGGFRRGFGMGTGLGLGLLVSAVVLSVIGGIFSLISLGMLVNTAGGDNSASVSTETIWGDPGATSTLRAIDITGAIMTAGTAGGLFAEGTYGYEVADMLDDLDADDADGVVLLVDTPGGTITGSKAVADAVIRYQDRTGNKVIAHVQGMSASGGVYATAPADLIYADHGSLIGSVGVIYGPFTRFDGVVAIGSSLLESGVTTTGGITQEYFTKGTGKDFGNSFRDMTEAERQMMDDMLQAEYDRFVEHVATHRDMDAGQLVDEIGASVYEPGRAEELGFIDGTLGREEFFREAAVEAGLDPDDTAVEALSGPTGFEALFGVERRFGTSLPVSADSPRAVLNRDLCGGTQPLVIIGDPAAVCG